jgi:hypothetical protein
VYKLEAASKSDVIWQQTTLSTSQPFPNNPANECTVAKPHLASDSFFTADSGADCILAQNSSSNNCTFISRLHSKDLEYVFHNFSPAFRTTDT